MWSKLSGYYKPVGIVWHPARTWSLKVMWEVMTFCVIVHNMIVEDERNEALFDQAWEFGGELVEPQPGVVSFEEFVEFRRDMRDRNLYRKLQNDLVEHMWVHLGSK